MVSFPSLAKLHLLQCRLIHHSLPDITQANPRIPALYGRTYHEHVRLAISHVMENSAWLQCPTRILQSNAAGFRKGFVWCNILIRPLFSNTGKGRAQIEYQFGYALWLHGASFGIYCTTEKGGGDAQEWVKCLRLHGWRSGILCKCLFGNKM